MTLEDVVSVGAGPCAVGHLPAPPDPGGCALWRGSQRARPQLPQSTLSPLPHPCNVSGFLREKCQ